MPSETVSDAHSAGFRGQLGTPPVEANLHVTHHLAREVAIATIAFAKIDTRHAVGEVFQMSTG